MYAKGTACQDDVPPLPPLNPNHSTRLSIPTPTTQRPSCHLLSPALDRPNNLPPLTLHSPCHKPSPPSAD